MIAFMGGLGLLFSSQATSGVAILAFSILLAIVARIVIKLLQPYQRPAESVE